MPFAFTRSDIVRQDAICARLDTERVLVAVALAKYNAIVAAAQAEANITVEQYNEVLEEARGFLEDIVDQANDDFGDKSERWQDSDRGEEVRDWIDEINDARNDIDDLELLETEDNADLLDYAEKLRDISSRAGA